MRLTASNVEQALTPVIQETDGPHKGARHPIILEKPPSDSSRDALECVLQIHKTHVECGAWEFRHCV